MELLKIRGKIKLAEKGHKLLKERRDALVMEFMKYVDRYEEASGAAARSLSGAEESYSMASALEGSAALASASLAAARDLEVGVDEKNVMGVPVPALSAEGFQRRSGERGFDLAFTSPVVDEVAARYEGALGELVELAETENALLALANETRKTRRRVNALERRVIPSLARSRKMIQMRLEELERENFFRLKTMKRKKER